MIRHPRTSSHRYAQPIRIALGCTLVFMEFNDFALADVKLSVTEGSYEYTEAQKSELSELADSLKKNADESVTIAARTEGIKVTSLPYIIEQNRALRIFQELVRSGVPANRIRILPVNAKSSGAVLNVVVNKGEAIPNLASITPSKTPDEGTDQDFTINFPSASAEPVNLSEDRFKAFLSSVGQPGRDAIVIEGFTDTVGNAKYNQALGELRALSVYARMINAGLPPYRIDTQSRGMSAAKKKGDSAEDRKVVIRWTQNAKVAEEAKQIETPSEPLREEPAPPVKTIEPEPVKTSESEAISFDIVPFAGVLMPVGDVADHAKTDFSYGLGIGKAFIVEADREIRATLFYSANTRHEAKESDRSGPLDVQATFVRADYAQQRGSLRPFLGLGLGIYKWDGTIVQPSTLRLNTGSRNDIGGVAAIGLDFVLQPDFILAPEINCHFIGGEFSETLLGAVLSLRWRI